MRRSVIQSWLCSAGSSFILTVGCVSGLGLLAPAIAQTGLSQVESWRYDSEQVRLEITTTGSVRPSLFTLQDPPRVVLDFANTTFTEGSKHIPQIGKVQSLRISQMDTMTTRFVLTLERDVSLTSDLVQLQTAGPERWAVQFLNADALAYIPPSRPLITSPTTTPTGSIPSPTLTPAPPPAIPAPSPVQIPSGPGSLPAPPQVPSVPLEPLAPPTGSAPIVPATTPPAITPPRAQSPIPGNAPQLASAGSSVQLIQVTPVDAGFFVRTTGPVSVTTRRITNPDRIVVDFLGATLSKGLTQRALTVQRQGVNRLRVGQFEPTIARVVLDVDPTASDWESQYDPQQGGVLLRPGGGRNASLRPDPPPNYDGPLATISGVNLVGNELTIRGDGFLFYESGWDPQSGGYRISVTPARLPASLPDPGLPIDGPVERIRFRQETERTVSILVQPSKDFNVTQPAPGQGSRQITLLVQALDGSVPAAPVTVPGGVAQPTYTAPVPGQAIVALDPGHGGRDPGAVGVNGVQEKVVNLNISNKVAQFLQAEGISYVFTRTDDREILLQPRVDTAVRTGATIMVSIHTNAFDRSGINGIETYYLRPDSARLATTMHRFIVGGTGAFDRGVRRANFFMVRETPTTMPSVLLELGYLSNPAEASKLATDEYQTQVARAVANGIKAYLQGSP